ncbi:PQQ-binding-like beta-propeller repeat protein, partial [candidate division WOR-3 bacterium]|nr:PQQ-binding-like beta-propeller repeat protein [candidate division WOR-3 bacterium]
MFRGFKIFAVCGILLLFAGQGWSDIFIVNNGSDVDNGLGYDVPPDSNTLRKCIRLSNEYSGPDRVEFDIPYDDPGFRNPDGEQGNFDDYWTIQVNPSLGTLPSIIDAYTTIDGYTQKNATPATDGAPANLNIEIDGSNAGNNINGLYLASNYDVVRGLCINGFDGNGIFLNGWYAHFDEIIGNYIGTNTYGTEAKGNHKNGLYLWGSTDSIIIGGTEPQDRNIISGNWKANIWMQIATKTQILGNYIGTGVTGMRALPPDSTIPDGGNGIVHWAEGIVGYGNIGDTLSGARNVISGNPIYGIYFYADPAVAQLHGNKIIDNYIGVARDGRTPLGNGADGVFIKGNVFSFLNPPNWADSCIISQNTISCNGGCGIRIDSTYLTGVRGGIRIDHNYIGTNSFWDILGNEVDGIAIENLSYSNLIRENTITFNQRHGIYNRITHNAGETPPPNGDNLIDNNMIALNDSCGIYNLGASPKIINNQFTDNGKYGIGNFVHFGGTYAPEDYSDDILSWPIIGGTANINFIATNLNHGIYSLDCIPLNETSLMTDNLIFNNNDSSDVVQEWYGSVEILKDEPPDYKPITDEYTETVTITSSGGGPVYEGSNYSPRTPYEGVWGPEGIEYTDIRTWFKIREYEYDKGGNLHEYNRGGSPSMVKTEGYYFGDAEFSFDADKTTQPIGDPAPEPPEDRWLPWTRGKCRPNSSDSSRYQIVQLMVAESTATEGIYQAINWRYNKERTGLKSGSGQITKPEELWTHTLLGDINYGNSPLAGDLNRDGWDDIVIGDGSGYVYAIDGPTGNELWHHQVSGAIGTPPGLADFNLDTILDVVIGSVNDTVYALNGIDGTLLWAYGTGGPIQYCAPLLVDINR